MSNLANMRREVHFMLLIWSLLGRVTYTRAVGFDAKIATGPTAIIGPNHKFEGVVYMKGIPLVLDIGCTFTRTSTVWIDGQLWWPVSEDIGHPMLWSLSVLGGYHFVLEKSPRTRPYVLLGIGYGLILFYNEKEKDNDVSGKFQIQSGGGIEYQLTEWFRLGLEGRIRIGIPNNPDVVGISLLGVASFSP